MNELLSQPAVQSSLVPFVTALIASIPFVVTGRRWSGLVVAVGFYVAVYFITSFEFFPLTSTRKLLLCGLVSIVPAMLLDGRRDNGRYVSPAIFILAGAALLWVVWPLVQQAETVMVAVLLAGGGVLYVGGVTVATTALREQPYHAGAALLSLAMGTGAAAVMGASALLGQLALALGSACGAWLLLAVVRPQWVAGFSLTLPAAFLAALIGYSGVVYASLPWYVLIPLALIPILVYAVPQRNELAPWREALRAVMVAAPAAIIAVVVAWKVAGAPPM
jgi:hypothetical protein